MDHDEKRVEGRSDVSDQVARAEALKERGITIRTVKLANGASLLGIARQLRQEGYVEPGLR